jgi:S1-C subfamily serine protease
MPTAVQRTTGNAVPVEGIAFAIPSNRILDITNRIIAAGGSITRPSFGMDSVDINDLARGQRPRNIDQGEVVTAVLPGGPAAAVGIAVGDVIIKVDGVDITSESPLLNTLLSREPGQNVRVVFNRNGRIIETDLRLGTRT